MDLSRIPAVVIYSGGLDSTVLLHHARHHHDQVSAVSFTYGQRHLKELDIAADNTEDLLMPHHFINLENVFGTGYFDNVEMKAYDEIEGIPSTWVPNRNTVFTSVAAAIAMREYRGSARIHVYCGIHAGDSKYPDTTTEWFYKMRDVLWQSTTGQIVLQAPFVYNTKRQIVEYAKDQLLLTREQVENSWSCYLGGETHCGNCATCRERNDALSIYDR